MYVIFPWSSLRARFTIFDSWHMPTIHDLHMLYGIQNHVLWLNRFKYPRSRIHDAVPTIYDLLSRIHDLWSAIRNLQSAILYLRNAIRDLRSAICGPRSVIHDPWSQYITNRFRIELFPPSLTVCQPSVHFDCGLVVLSPRADHHSIRCHVLWVWLCRVDAPDA